MKYRVVLFSFFSALLACGVYPQWDGIYNAGPVDPIDFPPPYLGVGGNRARPALGTFTAVAGVAGGRSLGYFAFPFSTAALPSGSGPKPDPLAIAINGLPNPAVPVPVVEVFDGTIGERPFPLRPVCVPELYYSYDPRRDDMHYDEQSPIFATLPTASYSPTRLPTWSYAPIVAEKRYTNDGQCQRFRAVEDPSPVEGDGYYLAWAIIDPGAAVYDVGQSRSNSTGIGLQRFAWYDHYIVAFLEGGYIPTQLDAASDGTPVLHMVPQKIYFPRSQVLDSKGMPKSAGLGQGYDVLEAKRGRDDNYSPVCQAFSYDTTDPLPPEELPQDANDVVARFGGTLQPANPPYFFCLQVH